MTQQRLWLAFAVVAGVGLAIQLSRPVEWSDRPETTFDTAPRGHAAVLDLLDHFDSARGRWLSGVSMPPVEDTVWWIAPDGACEKRAGTQPSVTTDAATADIAQTAVPTPFQIVVRPWIEAGGTAIVWLSHPPLEKDESARDIQPTSPGSGERPQAKSDEPPAEPDEPSAQAARESWAESFDEVRDELRNGRALDCEAIAGFALPPRRLAGLEFGQVPEQGRYSPLAFSIGRAVDSPHEFDYHATRILPGPTLAFFDVDRGALATSDWRPLWIEADDATPLALERSVGKGRLVVIADARILTNDRLGSGDSAPFVFDWVRDYGTPWIDEHAHGVVPVSGTFRYLATSPASSAGLGMLVIGLLFVWRANAWPAREVAELDPDAPTLADFVDSVAQLYAGTHDHARVFERYRALCLDRIRRALGLAPGTSSEIVLASLRAKASSWPALGEAGLGQLLTKNVPIPGASDLARNAARLDELVGVLRAGRRLGAPGTTSRGVRSVEANPTNRGNAGRGARDGD